jgi:hypothetical protein
MSYSSFAVQVNKEVTVDLLELEPADLEDMILAFRLAETIHPSSETCERFTRWKERLQRELNKTK